MEITDPSIQSSQVFLNLRQPPMDFLSLWIAYPGKVHPWAFCGWHFHLEIMFLRFIHIHLLQKDFLNGEFEKETRQSSILSL
jgi:hypothetical protein